MKSCSLGSLCGVLQGLGLHKHSAPKKSRSVTVKHTAKKTVKKVTKTKAKKSTRKRK